MCSEVVIQLFPKLHDVFLSLSLALSLNAKVLLVL